MTKRVLVVAGREGISPVLQMQIELWGDDLDFSLATSGNEALWEIRGSPYDLVLASWQIPEMTGMEFAEVVRALSPATKVVLIGASVTPALQAQAEALGVYALLGEASLQEVAAIIGRALEVPLPRPRPAAPPPQPELTPEVVARPVPAPEPAPQPAVPTPAEPIAPTLSLTPSQQAAVQRALRELLDSIGPQVALLVSRGGEVLVTEGATGGLPITDLSGRALSALAEIADLAQLLKDEHLLGLCLFAGSRYDVYAFTVTDGAALLLVFDKAVVEGKLGSVWLYTRRVVEELGKALS